MSVPTNKPYYKETNETNVWQKYRDWEGFEPRTPGRKANTITTKLKKKSLLRSFTVLYLNRDDTMLEEEVFQITPSLNPFPNDTFETRPK